MSDRTLTVAEAAAALGISEKAVRRRIERGVLASQLVDGKRRIPASAVGLGAAAPPPRPRGSDSPPTIVAAKSEPDLIDRLERLAREAGAARQLEVVVGHQEQQLIEARARIVELEAKLARRRRWFRRAAP